MNKKSIDGISRMYPELKTRARARKAKRIMHIIGGTISFIVYIAAIAAMCIILPLAFPA